MGSKQTQQVTDVKHGEVGQIVFFFRKEAKNE